MAYGLSMEQQQQLTAQLAEIMGVDAEIIADAMAEVTKVELRRVARDDRATHKTDAA